MSNPKNATGAADPRRFKLIPLDKLTPKQRQLTGATRSGPRAAACPLGATMPDPLSNCAARTLIVPKW